MPDTWAHGVAGDYAEEQLSTGESVALGALPLGSQVADYQIEEQVGQGGMAVVYRATDVRLRRTVALKVLAPELAGDAAFRERFIREMRAAAAVDHPHIVPVFDAGEANGALFIAMLYAGGHDVRTLIVTQGPLPAARVAGIVTQVASALDAAHAQDLIHRDVKPGNLLLAAPERDGEPDHVYLSDFGLSKQSYSSASLTLTGQFLGTIDYMAPEQVEGTPIDGRADLYGLACAAYEMFTGRPPFQRSHNFAAIWAQLSAPPPPLAGKRPDLPPAVDGVFARALAKSPDDRYPSCGEFAAALRAACGAGPAPAALPPGPGGAAEASTGRTGPAGLLSPAGAYPQAAPYSALPTLGRPVADSGAAADRTARPARRDPGLDSFPLWWRDAPPRPQPSDLDPGLAPGAPGPPPLHSPQRPARKRPSRGPAIAGGIAGCAVILVAAAVLLAMLHRRNAAAPPPPPRTPAPASPAASPAVAGPKATVKAYIAAINARRYRRAWNLGGRSTGQPYKAFAAGYAQTARDNLTIVSVSGDVVTVRLEAVQNDGTVKHFHGSYTVRNGVIVIADMHSGP